MSFKSNSGIEELAAILDRRIREGAYQPQILDFAEIQPDGSLLTNTFPVPVPKTGYRICRQLSLGDTGGYLADVSTSEGSGRAHIPEKMRSLKAGDRVLIAWVQKIPVVIDIILRP